MTGKYEKSPKLPQASACVPNASNPSANLLCAPPTTSLRMAPFDGSAWEEEDDEAPPPPDVPYYNNFPGKQPPPGGLIDMRTRPGATLVSSKRAVVENGEKVDKIRLSMWQNPQYFFSLNIYQLNIFPIEFLHPVSFCISLF